MHESWKPFLSAEFEKPYFKELAEFLHEAYETKTIFPVKQNVFRAFLTDLNEVHVVILGQDPYHTPGAAMGLAFSVPDRAPVPPSLINIYKEIDSDIGHHANKTGNLVNWQNQGELLLNYVLTVEAHKAGVIVAKAGKFLPKPSLNTWTTIKKILSLFCGAVTRVVKNLLLIHPNI